MLGTLDKIQQSKTKSASLFLKMKKTKKNIYTQNASFPERFSTVWVCNESITHEHFGLDSLRSTSCMNSLSSLKIY